MMILPRPERVARGRRHWFLWFVQVGGQGRILVLKMVPR